MDESVAGPMASEHGSEWSDSGSYLSSSENGKYGAWAPFDCYDDTDHDDESEVSDDEPYIRNKFDFQVLLATEMSGEAVFSHDRIRSYEVPALIEALPRVWTITKLSLIWTWVDGYSGQTMADVLASTRTLTTLDLTGCRFEYYGFDAFISSLKDNSMLTKLVLAHVSIPLGIAKRIGGMLRSSNTLRELDISHCGINWCGGEALAWAIRENEGLTALNIAHNNIGDGVREIAKAIENNSSLTSLNMLGNLHDENDARITLFLLQHSMQKNTTLTSLEVETCANPQYASDVMACVAANKRRSEMRDLDGMTVCSPSRVVEAE